MVAQIRILGVIIVVMWALVMVMAAVPPEQCSRSCGDVDILYPFGMLQDGPNCWLNLGFSLRCDHSFRPPKLFQGDVEVTSISLASAQITILLKLSYNCYTSVMHNRSTSTITLRLAFPYTISPEANVFMAIGCDTMAKFAISENNFAGCISGCNGFGDAADGICSGIGCCQASIPPDVSWYKTSFINRTNTSSTLSFNPCSYSFISQKGNYTFRKSDLKDMDSERPFPIVLDFAIDSVLTCEMAKAHSSSYACVSTNSECVSSARGAGYVCNCSAGYQGNPYVRDGCQDIDECQSSRELYPCYGVCINLPGSYNCTCLDGYYADDPRKTRCMRTPEKEKLSLAIKLTIGIGCGTLLLLLIGAVCCLVFQRRKLNRLRKKNFDVHGGSFLQQLLSNEGSTFKIFSMDELHRATNSFHKDQILGSGGFGTVYKGTLDDQMLVAIKRANASTEKNGRDFANELYVLSKVNHRHIVELVGCGLEDKVPMLVYKFMPKGALYNFIHGGRNGRIPFATRVRIATEAAEAFKYLHFDASTPVLHGDVKSLNILLDEGDIVKISDFGTSKILSKQDEEQFATMVKGTYGYLDPEYMLNGHLTERSDVYSFGVVLAELMTRRKPFNFDTKSEEEISLASKFISCMENEKLVDILDPEITEGGLTYEVMKVADVARRCLNVKGEERPTMREVFMELHGIRVPERHPWTPPNVPEETTPPTTDNTISSLEMGPGNEAIPEFGHGC